MTTSHEKSERDIRSGRLPVLRSRGEATAFTQYWTAVSARDRPARDRNGESANLLLHKTLVALAVTVRFMTAVEDPYVGFKIHDRTGMVIFETNTYCMKRRIGRTNLGCSAWCSNFRAGSCGATIR